MPSNLSNSFKSHSIINARGFTLVEIIIGIVVLSISLSIISTLIVPAEQKSADQILQVKAAELGQSFLNDISSRAFDQNSDMAGGLVRCGEPTGGSNPCTLAGNFGPDAGEINRGLFNDVDDFDGFSLHVDANNESLDSGYSNFIIDVSVIYDGTSLGFANNNAAKRITVSVTTPLGTEIQFATHRANF